MSHHGASFISLWFLYFFTSGGILGVVLILRSTPSKNLTASFIVSHKYSDDPFALSGYRPKYWYHFPPLNLIIFGWSVGSITSGTVHVSNSRKSFLLGSSFGNFNTVLCGQTKTFCTRCWACSWACDVHIGPIVLIQARRTETILLRILWNE